MQAGRWIMLNGLIIIWALLYTYEFRWADRKINKAGTFKWRFVAPLTITFMVYLVLFIVILFGYGESV